MSIVFIASEVGSVRALEPVIHVCRKQYETHVIDCGFFSTLTRLFANELKVCAETESAILQFLEEYHVELVVFSVNVKDTQPLTFARVANKKNIPTLHILDYWNEYANRMRLDKGAIFNPTIYAVPDAYAADCALNEGIDSNTIVITGQPALAEVVEQYQKSKSSHANLVTEQGFTSNKKMILFASEPVASDQGSTYAQNQNYRGYTEKNVLTLLMQACLTYNDSVDHHADLIALHIVPHPRENTQSLSEYWSSIGGDQVGKIIHNVRGRDLLCAMHGVAGMSSSLLYEAWLVGKPVLSIQPGLLNNSLRIFENKEGIEFIDAYSHAVNSIIQWLSQLPAQCLDCAPPSAIRARGDHLNSAQTIIELIQQQLASKFIE